MPNVEKERMAAARVAGCAELRDVRLFAVSGDLSVPTDADALGYKLDVNIDFQTLGKDVVHALFVTANYDLAVIQPNTGDDDDSDEPTTVADLSFTYAALYSLLEQDTDPQTFGDEEFEAFARTTGQFALYPYARAFVADMTGRMGLPSLHLGTLRFDRETLEED